MSQESAFEFVARLQRDEGFRREYARAKVNCAAGQFLKEMGFNFNLAELQVARKRMGFDPRDREIVRDLSGELKGAGPKPGPGQLRGGVEGLQQPRIDSGQLGGGQKRLAPQFDPGQAGGIPQIDPDDVIAAFCGCNNPTNIPKRCLE